MPLWEDNIEIGPKAVGWEDVDFSYLAEDRVKGKAVVKT